MTSFAENQDDKLLTLVPDKKVSVREAFGVDIDMTVPAFSEPVVVAPSATLPPEVVSQTAHNNLDVVMHEDRLFLALRTAPSHFASADTHLYVVSTADQATWRFEGDNRPHRDG